MTRRLDFHTLPPKKDAKGKPIDENYLMVIEYDAAGRCTLIEVPESARTENEIQLSDNVKLTHTGPFRLPTKKRILEIYRVQKGKTVCDNPEECYEKGIVRRGSSSGEVDVWSQFMAASAGRYNTEKVGMKDLILFGLCVLASMLVFVVLNEAILHVGLPH